MTHSVYKLYQGGEKRVDKVVTDENIHYMHFTLPSGEGMPEHNANSNVYMTVVRGTLTIRLGDGESGEYEAHSMLTIPVGTKMKFDNCGTETLELIVVKAPAPVK